MQHQRGAQADHGRPSLDVEALRRHARTDAGDRRDEPLGEGKSDAAVFIAARDGIPSFGLMLVVAVPVLAFLHAIFG
eukprot:CAMPEP_0174850802 /NCGR_PEP_ID=MMETSP1114-20130205/21148_1 /TAXON_ID=312471 /ORGANISM="Neobodo designis, Strain CCAP 1951/1" /LENGTH=76 /DNA_ID=CAMNT_0016085289 /DNA_START=31 /DNA_END=257 /DNA_ORIENTATION=+